MPTETKTKPKPRPRKKTPSAEEVARGFFAAFAARDLDGMASHWHPDVIEDLVPVGVLRGPDELREFFRANLAAVPDLEMVVEAVVADDSSAMVRWRLTGTFSGEPFQGIEPNGKRIELRGSDHIEVEKGKIVRNTAYYDGASFARAVGLLPPKDSGAEKAMLAAFNAVTRGRALVRDRLGNR